MSGRGIASVSLKALSIGVDKIPDKYWHKIPIFCPPEEKARKKQEARRRRQRSRSSARSESSDDEEYDYENDRRSDHSNDRDHHHQPRQARYDTDWSRQDENQKHTFQVDHAYARDIPSFPPTDHDFWREQDRAEAIPTVPTTPYVPYVSYPPMADYPYGSAQQDQPNYRKYNPADYQPPTDERRDTGPRNYYQPSYNYNAPGYPPQPTTFTPYPQDPYVRPHSNGPPAQYGDSYSTNNNYHYNSDDRGRNRSDRRKSKTSRRRSRSRSRSSSGSVSSGVGTTGKIKKKFDTSSTGITTAAIGAIAGGILGNEFGKSPLATVAGVAIGGFGANFLEAKDHKKKVARRMEDAKRAKSARRDRSRDRSGGGGHGGRRDRHDNASEDSYSDYSDGARRRTQRRD